MKPIIESWQTFLKNKNSRPTVIFVSPDNEEVVVNIVLAQKPEELQKGLMFRKNLGESNGMLFIFPNEEIQRLWMKNTYIPLDMIHINKKKQIVGIVEDAEPLDLKVRSVGKPALYVLEVNAFFARRNQINKQWHVKFAGF